MVMVMHANVLLIFWNSVFTSHGLLKSKEIVEMLISSHLHKGFLTTCYITLKRFNSRSAIKNMHYTYVVI